MGDDDKPKGDEVQTPLGDDVQTSEKDQTFTQAQLDAAVRKAESDAKTDVSRLTKGYEEAKRVADAAMKRLQQREDEDYRRQEESAKDDPDELTRIRRRRQDADRERELSDREAKLSSTMQKILSGTASALSKTYNVSAEHLIEFGGEDADKMETLAKSYGERKPSGDQDGRRQKDAPDDGKTKGGGAGLTREDLEKMSPEEQNQRADEIAKMSFG